MAGCFQEIQYCSFWVILLKGRQTKKLPTDAVENITSLRDVTVITGFLMEGLFYISVYSITYVRKYFTAIEKLKTQTWLDSSNSLFIMRFGNFYIHIFFLKLMFMVVYK